MGKSYNLLDLGSFIFIYFIQVSLVDNVLISTVEQNDFFFIFLEIIYFELKFKKKIDIIKFKELKEKEKERNSDININISKKNVINNRGNKNTKTQTREDQVKYFKMSCFTKKWR